jgi:uncharacterized protein (DUF2062 family)
VKARLGRVVESLLHLHDTPRRTALAFGIGLYLAFHPLLGLHGLMGLAIAFAFRLNRVALLTGVYVNNPWTLAPMYLAGTTVGCWMLGVPLDGLDAIDWTLGWRDLLRTLSVQLRPYLWPYVVGNTVLGIVSGLVGYAALKDVLERRHAARDR